MAFRKAPSSSSVEGSLPSSRKKYFDCQKTKGAGFKLPREAARSFNSRELLFFEIWEREAAPADYCLILRLFMDVSCPRMPLKILAADEFCATEQTTRFMAARCCHCLDCSVYLLLINIEISLPQRANL